MKEWYEVARKQLVDILNENVKVSGLEFLEDFVLENRDDYFEDLEFDDVDKFVSDEFDPFQNWLEESSQDSVRVGKNGKWYSINSNEKTSTKLKDSFNLTNEEVRLLELEALGLHSGKVNEFKALYQKLVATNFHELKYKCAFRLAKCAELNRGIHEDELIQFWENASDAAKAASLITESCDCKSRAAYHYVRLSNHQAAAMLYEEAFQIVDEHSYGSKMQLLKNARLQYQLFGDHESASKVFKKEKNLEYQEATKSSKIALFLYRMSSNYGESPRRVLWNCLLILILSTFFAFALDITVNKNEGALSFWEQLSRSAYYSVVTFTTLGYGDFYPKTELGHFFASLIALLGLIYSSLFMVTVVRKYSRT
ncbi:potassium channel family protein [Pseudoalteromonas sp. CST5]|uniref:potassium channel family protein n=1 Tax=unclassified Pseudoalteromonas TaxID=194690 RepID=UPI0023594BF7|nr:MULTISPECIES: potassium channel family protein [unclassified Pseudoalteromonas]MDC9512480.1 potassium channel family protein [Pseudoalteromonas sp. CST1]MDC9536716.1 potassium channel family protein [Pseudoalteromonas sp. CST3]MDC9540750.1 potassium channel family protein [Pseudoalteromonas sp. CST2]MDC9545425.1 potassium channel family protein [Pseudoalteromonas sp. CST4]MDC9549912.1 potassium channel family protein [Pseudoalteromonas sp. CST5]